MDRKVADVVWLSGDLLGVAAMGTNADGGWLWSTVLGPVLGLRFIDHPSGVPWWEVSGVRAPAGPVVRIAVRTVIDLHGFTG